ncbi:MAG: prolipoprotein diacylglyceryl transferase family protein [Acutalibacteraceae bacterium]
MKIFGRFRRFPVHPCFFYESMWCVLGFIVLYFHYKISSV